MTEQQPVTLITGASAGIGAALARTFARNGHALLLIARREQRLSALADEIAAQGYPRPHYQPVDLARRDAVEQITAAMARLGVEPDIVVNNAGFGLLGPAASLSRDEQLAMVDVNVRALADLSLAFVGALERRRGGILNVASVAAFLPGPNMAVYYATKAYVALLQRGAALGVACARRTRDRVMSGAGADRIPGACRVCRQSQSGPAHAIGRSSRRGRLSRLAARPAHGGAGSRESSRHGDHAIPAAARADEIGRALQSQAQRA